MHVDALAGGVLIELAHELLAVGVDDLCGQALLLILRHGAQDALDDARRGLGRVAGELEHGVDIAALAQRLEHERELGIQLVGIIHSHPQGCTKPSYGDMETARHIIETIDVKGKFFTPIVQVSPKLNGDIKSYPYTFEQTVELKEQPLTIQEASPEALEEKRRRELAKKAPNRFKRIESVFPGNLMSKKTVICIGCGGSRPFLETLARCGVGTFYLVDGDVVEDTNIATQGTYISEIGKLKTEVIRDRIMDINPMAKVVCINKFLDDEMTDNEFAYMTGLVNCRKSDTLLCGCTDNF